MESLLDRLEKRVRDPSLKLWLPLQLMDGGRNLVDVEAFETPNLLTNPGFEDDTNLLTNGNFEAQANLLTWTKTGDNTPNWPTVANCTLTSEAGTVKVSVNCLKLDKDGDNSTHGYVTQAVPCSVSTDYVLGVWANADAGNDTNETWIELNDDDGGYITNSAAAPVDGQWYWLEITGTTAGAATTLNCVLKVNSGTADADDIAYYDGAILIAGTDLIPTNWTVTRATVHLNYLSKISDFAIAVVADDAGGAGASYAIQTIATMAGATDYTVGAWVNAPATNDFASDIGIRDNEGDSTYSADVTSDGTWQWLQITHTTHASTASGSVRLRAKTTSDADADDIAYFDGVILLQASSLIPTGWAATGGGGTKQMHIDYNAHASGGTFSTRIFRGGTHYVLGQTLAGGAGYKSTAMTLGVWCWTDAAATGEASVYDGVGLFITAIYHTGGGSWEWLTGSGTSSASTNQIWIRLQSISDNADVYWDAAVLVEGSSLYPGWTAAAGAIITASGEQYKIGSSSMKVVGTAANSRAVYQLPSATPYIAKTLTAGCWYYRGPLHDTTAMLTITDESAFWANNVLGGAVETWIWETVSKLIPAATANLYVNLYVATGGESPTGEDYVYFDGVVLQEAMGISEKSGYGTGINVSGCSWTGQGWVFDGVDDYLWVPAADSTHLDFTGAFSFITRLKYNIGTADKWLINRGAWNTSGWGVVLSNADALVVYFFQAAAQTAFTTTDTLTDGELYTVGFNYDGTNGHIYINGELSKSGALTAPVTDAVSKFVFGAASDLTTPVDMTDKVLGIWNRILSPQEHMEMHQMMSEVFP